MYVGVCMCGCVRMSLALCVWVRVGVGVGAGMRMILALSPSLLASFLALGRFLGLSHSPKVRALYRFGLSNK